MRYILLTSLMTFVIQPPASAQVSAPTVLQNPLQQRLAPAPNSTPESNAIPVPTQKTTQVKPVKGAGALRKKQCSQDYQAAKKANTLSGQTWPKFYSACNAKLKAAGQ
jgi:hypothetical protein